VKNSLFLLLLTTPALAQTPAQNRDETAVRQVIDQLFAGMKAADTTQLRAVFLPGTVFQTVRKDRKSGAVSVRNESVSEFITSVGGQKPGALDEQLTGCTIHIDSDLATAWTPYTFFYNGQSRHCGANAFTLVRTATGWKIQYLIDTRRPCS
jgi:hypothetical protein